MGASSNQQRSQRNLVRQIGGYALTLSFAVRSRVLAAVAWQKQESQSTLEKLTSRSDSVTHFPAASSLASSSEIAWLSSKLRRYPWWWFGHSELSALALAAGQLELAYGAAQCALQLAHSQTERGISWLALGRSLLANNDSSRAADACRRSIELLGDYPEALETLAAAELAAENFEGAVELFNRIPSNLRSARSSLALDWAKQKIALRESESINPLKGT